MRLDIAAPRHYLPGTIPSIQCRDGAKGKGMAKWKGAPLLWQPDTSAKLIGMARKYLPDAKLVLLEANVAVTENPQFQEIVKYYGEVAKAGGPFDYSGHQAHFYGITNKKGVRQVPATFTMGKLSGGLDLLASLGKPVVITEYNPPSRNNKQKVDPATQARLSDKEIAAWSVNYYTLVFSKPYARELTRWFIIDDLGGRGTDAGLVTKTGEKKEEYFALKKLLNETWHTDWKGNATNGGISFRGFYGTYEAVVDGYKPVRFSCDTAQARTAQVTLRK
jgi:hypothetical protein